MHYRTEKLRYSGWVLALLLGVFYLVNSTSIFAAGISSGYITNDTELVNGMVASLSPGSTDEKRIIERANLNNGDKVVGIVTTISESLITLTDDKANVYVAISGQVSVYVSDVNGPIKQGDFLQVSPLLGILMKSPDHSSQNVVGVASQDFNTEETQVRQIQTDSGNTKDVNVGTIQIEMSQGNIEQSKSGSSFLVQFGESLTGKSVNVVQVIIAFVIFFIVLIVEGSIVYGAIQSSITAVGRNPLAKSSIYKQLVQVSLLAIAVFVVGMGAAYLVLWI